MPAPDMSTPDMLNNDLPPDLPTVQSTESRAGEYRSRLSQQRNFQRAHQRRASLIGYTAVFFLLLGVAIGLVVLLARGVSPYWIFIPSAGFLIFTASHSRALRHVRRCERVIAFYERGLARLENRWMGAGQSGEQFLDPSHPYARDLDLFGKGSIFELLCSARTRTGEQTLANWLLAPAEPAEVLERQSAIADLRGRLDLRENLAVAAEDIRSNIPPAALAEWGERPPVLQSSFVRTLLPVLAVAWIASAAAWAIWGHKFPAIALTIINVAVYYKFRARAAASLSSIGEASHDLDLLAQLLVLLECENFSSPRLVKLQHGLQASNAASSTSPGATSISPSTTPEPVSRAVAELHRRVEMMLWSHHIIVQIIDFLLLWNLQCAFAIDAWRSQHGCSIRAWLSAVGEVEALSDLASYAYEHPHDVFPEFAPASAGSPCFHAVGLAHPLIPEAASIRNDLRLDTDLRLIIISGPNMAGKSTFIRAVGINAVLAQCGAPVRARRLQISQLNVAASVVVLDSLQGGISRFYAEILRLRQITELAKGPIPVLYLLDELLQGTNSHDRRIGAEAILRSLFNRGAIGLVTTHDLALTEIAAALGPQATNAHFEDRIENGKLHFDHRLSPGIVQTSSALELMRSIGLEV
jgi:MutS domain V